MTRQVWVVAFEPTSSGAEGAECTRVESGTIDHYSNTDTARIETKTSIHLVAQPPLKDVDFYLGNDTYVVNAKDKLDAFIRARKMRVRAQEGGRAGDVGQSIKKQESRA